MKKLLTNVATAILAGVLCLGLSACGGAKVDAEEEAKNLVGAEVTAEQWTAAMAAFAKEDAKYTVNISATMVFEHSIGKVTQTASGRQTIDGNKTHIVFDHLTSSVEAEGENVKYLTDSFGNTEKFDVEYFQEISGTDCHTYAMNDEGNWSTGMSDGGHTLLEFSLMQSFYLMGSIEVKGYGIGDYEFYSYNEDEKGYYFNSPDPELPSDALLIKFNQDGKVAACIVKFGYPDWGGTVTYELYYTIDYTEKEVTLPEVTEESQS